jgi:hypothetical protein
LRIAARALRSSRLLAIQTVHVTSDAIANPIITAFTMRSACTNMPQGERSCGNSAMAMDGGSALGAGAALLGLVAGSGLAAGACACAAGAGVLSLWANPPCNEVVEIASTRAAMSASLRLDGRIFPASATGNGPAIGQVRLPRQAIHFRTSIDWVQF